jgi:hypothetical protein
MDSRLSLHSPSKQQRKDEASAHHATISSEQFQKLESLVEDQQTENNKKFHKYHDDLYHHSSEILTITKHIADIMTGLSSLQHDMKSMKVSRLSHIDLFFSSLILLVHQDRASRQSEGFVSEAVFFERCQFLENHVQQQLKQLESHLTSVFMEKVDFMERSEEKMQQSQTTMMMELEEELKKIRELWLKQQQQQSQHPSPLPPLPPGSPQRRRSRSSSQAALDGGEEVERESSLTVKEELFENNLFNKLKQLVDNEIYILNQQNDLKMLELSQNNLNVLNDKIHHFHNELSEFEVMLQKKFLLSQQK